MKRIILYPYKLYSNSTKLLVKQLEQITGKWVRRITGTGKYTPKTNDLIINWGNSHPPNFGTLGIINDPNAVAIAINKIDSFRMFDIHGVRCPKWTTNYEEALDWINRGRKVVCRSLINGNSGNGITMASNNTGLIKVPLYVEYKKKAKEFRVHVFKEKIIDVVEKRKRNGFNNLLNANTYIRSHNNGWVFCRNNIEEPKELREIALKAIKALGLDFGAIDIIWNKYENLCYILEINTAPGLDNKTTSIYKDKILECLQ